MSNRFTLFGREHAHVFLIVGFILLASSLAIFVVQVRHLATIREQLENVGERLPELRARIRILEANIEAERLYGSDARASQEEQASIFVLPERIDVSRTVRMLTHVIGAVGIDQQPLTLVSLEFDSASDDGARIATLQVSGSFSTLSRALSMLQWNGILSVGDVLGEDADTFLSYLESVSPLSLPSAEEFLRTDLLSYAADPDGIEQRFLRDLSSDIASEARTFVLESGLNDVRMSLTPYAPSLKVQRVWPFPLFTIRSFVYKDGRGIAEFTFFSRSQEAQ